MLAHMMINDCNCYAQSSNKRQLHDKQLHEEMVLSRSLYQTFNKASHLIAFLCMR